MDKEDIDNFFNEYKSIMEQDTFARSSGVFYRLLDIISNKFVMSGVPSCIGDYDDIRKRTNKENFKLLFCDIDTIINNQPDFMDTDTDD